MFPCSTSRGVRMFTICSFSSMAMFNVWLAWSTKYQLQKLKSLLTGFCGSSSVSSSFWNAL